MYLPDRLKLIVVDSNANVTCDSLRAMGADISIAGTAQSCQQAISLAAASDYDLVLLSCNAGSTLQIQELTRFIYAECCKPFLFIAHKSDADSIRMSIETRSFGVVFKPFECRAVLTTLFNAAGQHYAKQKYQPDIQNRNPHFFVKLGEKYKRVDWKDVVYLRSDNRYTCLFNLSDEREYPIRATLAKTMNEVMPQAIRNNFIQVNRAEAVQLEHITEFSTNELKTVYKTLHLSEGGSKQLRAKILCLT